MEGEVEAREGSGGPKAKKVTGRARFQTIVQPPNNTPERSRWCDEGLLSRIRQTQIAQDNVR